MIVLDLNQNWPLTKQLGWLKNIFFYTILGFTQSHSGALGDVDGFVQLIPGLYKSNKPINLTGIDEVHLKCDCNNAANVDGLREPILSSFALDKPPGHKIYKGPRNKLFRNINNSVLSYITFYLEDDDYNQLIVTEKRYHLHANH